jgi:hypothetical protein
MVEFTALEATVSRLPGSARDLLGRLAVFRRPFPLQAIEQGLGAGRGDWQPLIAWALLRYDTQAGDYRLHSLTADYASGLLVSEQRAATQAQVAQWYLDHSNQSQDLADALEAHALFSLAGEAQQAGKLAQRPTPEQEAAAKASAEHWRKVGDEAPAQAIARVEEAAKQLVTLTGTLQGLYFAVFAFSDLRQRVANPYLQLVFFTPLALWLGSLYCATRVFVPQARPGADLDDAGPNAWERIRATYDATVQQKLGWLQRAHRLLVISFAAVLLLLATLAFLPSAPDEAPTRILIVTPTPVP